MKKNKLFLFCLLAMSLCVCLFSCSDDEDGDTIFWPQDTFVPQEEAIEPSTQAYTPKRAGKITLYDGKNQTKEYSTLAAALGDIPNSGNYVITLEKGTYEEIGLYYQGNASIRIVGLGDAQKGTDVVIRGRGSDLASMGSSTKKGRELLEIAGKANLTLENLTLQSSLTRTEAKQIASNAGQLEVLSFDSTGTVAAYNCSFKSYQDTIRTEGKGWFYKCYIEGSVDFIWMEGSRGGVVALYEDCDIKALTQDNQGQVAVAAPRFEAKNTGKGVVIWKSRITRETPLGQDEANKAYLFRNPGASSQGYTTVAYVETSVEGFAPSLVASDQKVQKGGTVLGWQIDSSLAQAYPSYDSEKIMLLDSGTVSNEYSSRQKILNRICDPLTNTYKDDTSILDITAMQTAWDAGNAMAIPKSEGTIDSGIIQGAAGTYRLFELGDAGIQKGEPISTQDDPTGTGGKTQDGIIEWKNLYYNDPKYGAFTTKDTELKIKLEKKSIISFESSSSNKGSITVKSDKQDAPILSSYSTTMSSNDTFSFIADASSGTTLTLTFDSNTYIGELSIRDWKDETPRIKSITVGGRTKMSPSATQNLSATVEVSYCADKSVKWESSAPSIVSVDENTGVATGKSEGEATVTAKSTQDQTIKGTIEITVSSVPTFTFFSKGSNAVTYEANKENDQKIPGVVVSNIKAVWNETLMEDGKTKNFDTIVDPVIASGSVKFQATGHNGSQAGDILSFVVTITPPTGGQAKIAGVSVGQLDCSATGNVKGDIYIGDEKQTVSGTATGKNMVFSCELESPKVIEQETQVKVVLAASKATGLAKSVAPIASDIIITLAP